MVTADSMALLHSANPYRLAGWWRAVHSIKSGHSNYFGARSRTTGRHDVATHQEFSAVMKAPSSPIGTGPAFPTASASQSGPPPLRSCDDFEVVRSDRTRKVAPTPTCTPVFGKTQFNGEAFESF